MGGAIFAVATAALVALEERIRRDNQWHPDWTKYKEPPSDYETFRKDMHETMEESRKKMQLSHAISALPPINNMVKAYNAFEKAEESFNKGNHAELVNNLKIMIKEGGSIGWSYKDTYMNMTNLDLERSERAKESPRILGRMKRRLKDIKKDPEKYEGFIFIEYRSAINWLLNSRINAIDIKFDDLPFEEMEKYNNVHKEELYYYKYSFNERKVDPKYWGKPVHPFESAAKYFYKIGKPIEALSCIKKTADEEYHINCGWRDLLKLSLDCIDSIPSKSRLLFLYS